MSVITPVPVQRRRGLATGDPDLRRVHGPDRRDDRQRRAARRSAATWTPRRRTSSGSLSGYTLAFAVLLITGGRLGDIFGRRAMFLLGVAGFTAGCRWPPASPATARCCSRPGSCRARSRR